MAAKNDITGDLIKTRGRKLDLNEYPNEPDPWDESRMDVIGQNGSTGLHYLNEEGKNND